MMFLSGDNVKRFFSRVATLAFESSIIKESEKRAASNKIGDSNLVRKFYLHGSAQANGK